MKNLTLENLKEVLKKSTASQVHIYIPFDDLILEKNDINGNFTYYLFDKYAPQDNASKFITDRAYLEIYISNDLEWITCKTFSTTNHLKAIQTIISFLN